MFARRAWHRSHSYRTPHETEERSCTCTTVRAAAAQACRPQERKSCVACSPGWARKPRDLPTESMIMTLYPSMAARAVVYHFGHTRERRGSTSDEGEIGWRLGAGCWVVGHTLTLYCQVVWTKVVEDPRRVSRNI
jgi:hypothetical protein